MTRRGGIRPLDPVFDHPKKLGAIDVGNSSPVTPPAPPVLIPTTLTVVGSVAHADIGTGPHMVKDGDLLYVSGPNKLTIVDVSDPLTPTFVASYTDGTANFSSTTALAKDGDYVYLKVLNRITVVDVSNPLAMSVAGQLLNSTWLAGGDCVIKEGNYCYVGTSVRFTVLDVSTPTPVFHGGVVIGATYSAQPGVKDGNYCYIPSFNFDGIRVVDVSNPAVPVETGFILDSTNLDGASWAVKKGDYVMVPAQNDSRLSAVDVTVPATPTFSNMVTMAPFTSQLAGIDYEGNYAFVTSPTNDSVAAIDVTNPAGMAWMGVTVTDAVALDGAYGIVKDGNYCYVKCNGRVAVVGIT